MSVLRTNVEFAKRIFSDRLGDPYVYGGNWDPFNLKTGTDCSGLVGDELDAVLMGTAMPWQRSVSTESWPYDYAHNRAVAPGTRGPKGTIAIASLADAPPDAAVLVNIHHGGGGADSHTQCIVDGIVMESNGSHGTTTTGRGAMDPHSSYWTDHWYLPGPITGSPAASPPPAPAVPAGPPRTDTWADLEARLDGVHHSTHIIYTVQGTGQPDPTGPGYPADIARMLNPNVWTWQAVGNYSATAFPMNKSIKEGEDELVRLITQVHPDRTFALMGYSQGAIVISNVYDRIRNGDLQKYRSQLIAGVAIGNPRREEHHTVPGGVDPGGHGIVTPNLVDTDDFWWEFAAGKNMVNSPGQDLYATTGYNGDATSVKDMEAIWRIVDEGSITSFGNLLDQVLSILGNPILGSISAITAAIDALDFFVVKGIRPHTSYQFTQPVKGDGRDCWRMALDYLNWVGAAVPARIGVGSTPAIAAPTVVAPAPTQAPVVRKAAVIVPAETPALVPTTVPSAPETNGSTTVNLGSIAAILRDLPAIIKTIISMLTVAGTIAGSIATMLPATSGGTTAVVAGVGGVVGGLVPGASTHFKQ